MSRSNDRARRSNRLRDLEALEGRRMMSVSQMWFSGSTLCVKSDDASTSVEVRQVGTDIQVRDLSTSRSWNYSASSVGAVEFQGGAGNDRFVNNVASLPTRAFGNAGNDYLEGYNAVDTFVGGEGDDTLVGYGGNDQLWGGAGNDVVLGGSGDDQLMGGDGDDQLNGQSGNDRLWGENGNDVLVMLDAATGDWGAGGTGVDTFWVDRNGSRADTVADTGSGDKVQSVGAFANGADRTLDGDRIADPAVKAGYGYRAFAGNPLFAKSGPSLADIRQGQLGDCYYLAGLGAIANDTPMTLRQNIVDFNDGTYGVRLGNSFYRVDNDLPVRTGSTQAAFAALGRENSMWVAVAEKAFAHYRRGQNSYASIEAGIMEETNRAFGATSSGTQSFASYGNARALINDLYNRWNTYQSVTVGFFSGPSNGPLVLGHAYTVVSFVRDAVETVTGVVVRNPWGVDGGSQTDSNPYDGLVTLTAAQLFEYSGCVSWGRV
jgi:hypothetical protein